MASPVMGVLMAVAGPRAADLRQTCTWVSDRIRALAKERAEP